MGWMVRKYGLTIDRLAPWNWSLLIGNSEGKRRPACRPLLGTAWWWRQLRCGDCLRGRPAPAGIVLGGTIFHDAANADRLMRAYAHYAAAAPDELTTISMLLNAPTAPFIPQAYQGKPVFMIQVCYTGNLVEGEREVAPLRALGTPIADLITPMPYPSILALTEEATICGLAHDERSLLMRTLDDEALHTLAQEALVFMAPGMIVQLRVLGGAMSRVATDATAFAYRDAQAMIMVGHMGRNQHIRTICVQVWSRYGRPSGPMLRCVREFPCGRRRRARS